MLYVKGDSGHRVSKIRNMKGDIQALTGGGVTTTDNNQPSTGDISTIQTFTGNSSSFYERAYHAFYKKHWQWEDIQLTGMDIQLLQRWNSWTAFLFEVSGHKLETSQIRVFVLFSTLISPFFKMLFMNRLELSFFADFLQGLLKTEWSMVFYKICQ